MFHNTLVLCFCTQTCVTVLDFQPSVLNYLDNQPLCYNTLMFNRPHVVNMYEQHFLLMSISVPALHQLLPLECWNLLGWLLLEFRQRAVLFKAFVVQELTHGDIRQLLRQLEGLIDVEEDGEDVFIGACAHLDHIRQQERGALLQLGDICPTHHQFGWQGKRDIKIEISDIRRGLR